MADDSGQGGDPFRLKAESLLAEPFGGCEQLRYDVRVESSCGCTGIEGFYAQFSSQGPVRMALRLHVYTQATAGM